MLRQVKVETEGQKYDVQDCPRPCRRWKSGHGQEKLKFIKLKFIYYIKVYFTRYSKRQQH